MSSYAAVTNGIEIKTGMALCVRSGSLHRGDLLAIETASGAAIRAVVERSAMAELEISIGAKIVKCRPWARGDSLLCRNVGTSSNWTIQDVLQRHVV